MKAKRLLTQWLERARRLIQGDAQPERAIAWPRAWKVTATATRARRRMLGYWRGAMSPTLPDPSAFVDASWERDVRVAVGTYLRDPRFQQPYIFGGSSPCRFCNKPNGNRESSDGVFVWPSGLAHYLTAHAVRLPDEFVAHVLARTARARRPAPALTRAKRRVKRVRRGGRGNGDAA